MIEIWGHWRDWACLHCVSQNPLPAQVSAKAVALFRRGEGEERSIFGMAWNGSPGRSPCRSAAGAVQQPAPTHSTATIRAAICTAQRSSSLRREVEFNACAGGGSCFSRMMMISLDLNEARQINISYSL